MEQTSKTLRSDGLLERWEPGDGQGRKAGVEGVAVENKSRKKTTVASLTFSGNNWGPYRRQDFSEGLFHQRCRLCHRLILRPVTAPTLSVSQYILRRKQNGNITRSWWLRCPIVFDLPPSPPTPPPSPHPHTREHTNQTQSTNSPPKTNKQQNQKEGETRSNPTVQLHILNGLLRIGETIHNLCTCPVSVAWALLTGR